MSEKKKLEKYLGWIKKDLSILEFERCRQEIEKEFPNDQKWYENLSEEEKLLVDNLGRRAFYRGLSAYEDSINQWDKGLWKPNNEELEKLKKFQADFDTKILSKWDELKQETSSPSILASIEEEEKVSKERKRTLDELLENDKHRQKAEDLLKKYKNNPPFSDDNSDKDIENKFSEQITNLQNQIKDIENKQNQDSSLEKDHKYKKELERLKGELEELKRKNNQKTSPTSPEKKNSNFPYGGLIICGVVLIIIVLLLVFFFFFSQKRTNK